MALSEVDTHPPAQVEVHDDPSGLRTRHLASEQTRLLYDQTLAGQVATVTVGLGAGYVLWGEVPHGALLLWLGLLLGGCAFRIGTALRFRRTSAERREEPRWRRLFIAGAAISGTIWGIAGPMLASPASLAHQVFVAFVRGGMAAGAVPFLSAVANAYRAFVIPALVPFALWLILLGDSLHVAMGSLILLFLVLMLISSARIHASVCESLELRFGYDGLIKDLRRTKSKLLLANRDLEDEVEDRRRATETLRESEERFRMLSEATFEGIIIHENGIIRDANQVFADMFDYSLEEVIDRSVLDFTDAESHERALQNIMLRPDEPFELTGRRADGSIFPAEVRGKNLPLGGKSLRVVAVQDITERKWAESRLRDSEQRLSAILNNLQDTLYRTDRDGVLTWISPAVSQLLG